MALLQNNFLDEVMDASLKSGPALAGLKIAVVHPNNAKRSLQPKFEIIIFVVQTVSNFCKVFILKTNEVMKY